MPIFLFLFQNWRPFLVWKFISATVTIHAYRILVGKPEGKRPLGRQRRRWVDNIRMDLREIGWDGVDWMDIAQDRGQWRALVNTVLNLRVPLIAGGFLTGCTIGSSSRRAQPRK
jgi:hypothetical protein